MSMVFRILGYLLLLHPDTLHDIESKITMQLPKTYKISLHF